MPELLSTSATTRHWGQHQRRGGYALLQRREVAQLVEAGYRPQNMSLVSRCNYRYRYRLLHLAPRFASLGLDHSTQATSKAWHKAS